MSDPISTMYFHNMSSDLLNKILFKPRHIYPNLVLVQPRKTRPCLTKRLLMGRKESNKTKQNLGFVLLYMRGIVHLCLPLPIATD